MGLFTSVLALSVLGQFSPPAPTPATPAPLGVLTKPLNTDPEGPSPIATTTEASPLPELGDMRLSNIVERPLFQSDHEFDGFTGPFSNLVQFKDPRSLTEARFDFLQNWAGAGTPVIGAGSAQVYALQLRLALTDRLQIFADKDGIVRLSPAKSASITGLANIAAGVKYAFLRDVENQALGSVVLQYEAPTGYANIFQGQGSGNLGAYLVFGKEFLENWHAIVQFGQNAAMNNQNAGYFMTSAHIDRRFGRFTPFYEANWFYYNQSGTYLPSLGIEGGGLLNLGAGNIMGLNYLTNCIGFKYDLTKWAELGVGYEFQVSQPQMLFNNMLGAQLILRY